MKVDSIGASYIDEAVKLNQAQKNIDFSNSGNITPQGIISTTNIMDKDVLKDPQELKKLMEELKSKLTYLNSQLKIELDSEIDRPIVKIIDINTNQVIKQIPPDYIINIIKNINKLLAVLFEEKA